MPRLFFALWPPLAARDALQRCMEDPLVSASGTRPTRAENLHLTLGFLGSVQPGRLREVLEVGADIRAEPFALTLDRLEHWTTPGIHCLTPGLVPAPLPALAAALRLALRDHGLPADERPYRPHVTLCRQARTSHPGPSPVPVVAIEWRAEDFVLAESADDTGGSLYRIVERWPLRLRAG